MSHGVILRGIGGATRAAGPLIVQRTDDDFVENLLAECRDPGLGAVLATRATDTDEAGMLRLFQPIHRTYHLAMFEAVCDRPGEPRVDPETIVGAGMVIRRVASSHGSGPFGEAWRDDGVRSRGWVKLPSLAAAALDPDPAQRHLADQGQPELNARLREVVNGDTRAEEVVTLFPPTADACAEAGRTILFGLVPTVSAQHATADESAAAPFDADEVAAMVPAHLRAGKAASISELAGARFSYEAADELAQTAARAGDTEPGAGDAGARLRAKQMYGFVALCKVLAVQLDAFGESSDAATLRRRLSAIKLGFGGGPATTGADEFLAEAADALVMSPGTGRTILMPDAWPTIDPSVASAIRSALAKVLQARFAAFAPRATRFDDPEARYRVIGFVRVQREDGCPPDLVWSAPSAPFRIVPWYENGAAPPVLVRLPPLDRKNIKKLRPNVSFVVPKSLFCLLGRNSPKDFLDGKGQECSEGMLAGGLDWICGFNIPIITLCAFIILYVFLTLLNIVFFWLPFVRICFPIPRSAKELLP